MRRIKLPVFLFLGLSLLASCQSKAANENVGRPAETANIHKPTNSPESTPLQTQVAYSPTLSLIKASEVISRIGNVEAFKEGLCLKIQNYDLKPGDRVQVVILDSPQKTAQAEIVENADCKRAEFVGTLDYAFVEYKMKEIDGKVLDNAGYCLGLVNISGKPKIAGGRVAIDIDDDKTDEYFRYCTSNEGLHSTVWTGKPLVGSVSGIPIMILAMTRYPTAKKKIMKIPTNRNLSMLSINA